MKIRSVLLVSSLALSAAANAVTLADFAFEAVTPADESNVTTSATYAADAGLFAASSTVKGVHASAATDYSTPVGNGSANSFSSNTWAAGDYYEFSTSTTGYEDIMVSWDQARSGTGPNDFKLAYSTDGSSFTDFGTYVVSDVTFSSGTDKPEVGVSFDLSSVSALDNTSTVYFRLIATEAGSATGGTGRVDNFIVTGVQAVPEPASMVALGLGAAAMLRRRRKA